ncbi:MAG: OsmC family protein [Candidatus Nanohaloarchaea archaeon]
MVDYPVDFRTSSGARASEKTWSSKVSGESIKVSAPEEFGGEKQSASPEELYTASLENCLLATFKQIAERKGLEYEEISSEAVAELARNEDSRPVMKKVRIEIEVEGIEDEDQASRVKKAAIRNCFIHRSVKTEVDQEFRWL